jgi:diguanylate cyclase (GGDEF)-like protein/PAS domain S-box-containing protein
MNDTTHHVDSLAYEQIAHLEQRVAELEQQLAASQQEVADLRESRALLWSMIDYVPAMVYAKDLHGRYLLINRFYEQHTGYTSEQVVGRAPQEVFPGAPTERWHEYDQKVIETGQPYEFEDFIHYNHVHIPVLVIKFPCYTSSGALHAIGGIVLDMSEHYRAEEALRHSEEKYRMLAENMQDVVWTADTSLRLTYVSPSIYQLRGYTPEEALQQSVEELLTPDSLQQILAVAQKEQQTIERLELAQPCKDGSTVLTECITVPVYDDAGTLTGWVGVSRDVTARKQAEAEREQAYALMRAAVESATGGVLVVANDGSVVTCNQRFQQMWNLSATWQCAAADAWVDVLREQVAEPEPFVRRIAALSATPEAESYDLISLRDGRILERYSAPYRVGGEIAGRLWSHHDVTQRQQAETGTRETVQRLQAMFNNAAVGVVLADPQGDFVEINDRWAEMLGLSRGEVLRRHYLDVTHPADAAISQERLIPILRGDSDVLRIEKRYLRADGSVFWGDTSIRALRDEDGHLEGLIGVVVDITERRQAEAMLRLQERALASVTNGILITDATLPDMPITYCNAAFERMTGYTPAEILGYNCRFLQGPETDRAAIGQISELLKYDVPFQMTLLNYRKDGSPFWNELSITPLYDEQGHLTHHIGVINDVTERKQMQDALRASEEKFRGFFEQSRDGLILVNEEGTIIDWSQGAERVFGLCRADVVGRPYWDVLYQLLPSEQRIPEVYELIHMNILSLLQNCSSKSRSMHAAPYHVQRIFERPDGTQRVAATLVFPIYTAGHALMGFISRDITEQKQTEEELQRLNYELRQTNDHLGTSLRELEQRAREISLLNELSDFLQTCQSVEEAYNVFASVVKNLFVGQSGALYALTDENDTATLVAQWGPTKPWADVVSTAQCHAWRRRRSVVTQHIRPDWQCLCLNSPDSIDSFCAPLLARDEILGILRLSETPNMPAEARERFEHLIISVADHLALALANLKLRERLHFQAIRDPLTGLFNRRYLDETLTRELQRATRHNHHIGVIMLDVDHFKQINDTYGHGAGDMMLATIGTFLQGHTRGEDIACRYGGEEFTLILPEASLDDTYARAEQIRAGAQQIVGRYKEHTLDRITISLGVASFPEHGASMGKLLRAADAALYRAKTQGRNRTIVLDVTDA